MQRLFSIIGLTVTFGMVLFLIFWALAWVLACGMSDAINTCYLPFLGYIN